MGDFFCFLVDKVLEIWFICGMEKVEKMSVQIVGNCTEIMDFYTYGIHVAYCRAKKQCVMGI